ncbi:MAG TPA: hypothetical protein VEX41_08060 [Candidatus Eisenbacteria bacterium]|nr:hypothetical protein [Candidatus Eisenbacteria bacterium]
MAHRLQMKLGVVPEGERTADSPDTVVHIEPTLGSQARSKGHLYLLVTCRRPGPKSREATRLVADAIRSEYYYDESAGIRVCIVKSIHAANKRLAHVRDRLALGREGEPGPIGVAIAVIRDNELYVCTVGPAEAYMSRGARLSTLPDPHRDRGLPSTDLEPDVWRGDINVGDQLVLVSPNLLAALGPEELQDALVALHPQSAMEHLHQAFVTAGGHGSDAAIAIEAGEIAVSRAGRAPVPIRPAEPLAGRADRSPIPLAETVAGGVAAAQSGAEHARVVATGVLARALTKLQEALPIRVIPNRKVTPLTARRETQRRAAMAILSFVVVVGGLGLAVFVLGGRLPASIVIPSIETGQDALNAARTNLARVTGPGIDLVSSDPKQARELLIQALEKLITAGEAGVPSTTIRPLRAQAVTSLDRLFGMIDVTSAALFTFPADPPVDARAMIVGPDGVPYVLDAATATVYRVDLASGTAVSIYREGTEAGGTIEGPPRLMTVGGRDVLIVDTQNIVWRWRPADASGTGTTTRIQVQGSPEWGDDVLALGTFVRDASAGLYNLYVVDPSAQQILAYAPAADGRGFPAAATGRLAAPREVSTVTSLYIDGDIWVADAGKLVRFVNGKAEGWDAADVGDEVLRTAPVFTLVTSGAPRREGRVYGYDPDNRRVIAFSKVRGAFDAQYRLAGQSLDWAAIRDWYVEPGVGDGPDAIVWLTASGIHRAVLEPVAGEAEPSASDGSGAPSEEVGTAPPAP